MSTGKILKVRVGHEANCSSGMISMFMLMAGGVTYLPASLITAAVQAAALRADEPRGRKRFLFWLIPQIVGLGLTAVIASMAFDSGYSVTGPLVAALTMGVSFVISTTVSYVLVSRLEYRFLYRFLVCLIAPVVLVLSFVALAWLSSICWNALIVYLDPY